MGILLFSLQFWPARSSSSEQPRLESLCKRPRTSLAPWKDSMASLRTPRESSSSANSCLRAASLAVFLMCLASDLSSAASWKAFLSSVVRPQRTDSQRPLLLLSPDKDERQRDFSTLQTQTHTHTRCTRHPGA